MRVFLTGGTGLVGPRLVKRLCDRQDQVVMLTRRPGEIRQRFPNCIVVEGDPTKPGPWQDEAAGCDAVVNLAGEGIFNKRWSDEFKKLMETSRVQSTENVIAALKRNPVRAGGEPKVLVNASAIGYYGPHGEEELDESSPAGNDILARICVSWEKATEAAGAAGIRTALLRIGIVLDKAGGALKTLLPPFKMGMGGPAGSGKQWMAWIHNEDVAGLLVLALDHPEARGPINATAPNPVTNKDFGKALGRALHRPAFMPTPGFGLRLLLGEVADVVLNGQKVMPRRAQALGYTFQYPNVDGALKEILG